jgi:hypothetical protein
MQEASAFRNFKSELVRLVSMFREASPRFQAERFDEASLRVDYLTPLFRALGWDIENIAQLPQSLREVQVETRFYEDKRKRADYVFRTDGIDRFVCEAKGPIESLKQRGAYQAQRYAYNLGIRVAILTNFEYLQVFILGGKPDSQSPWDVWKSWRYDEYVGNATEIWDLFSREAVSRNGLEATIAALPKRSISRAGRQGWLIVRERVRPVDSDFLDYIEEKRVQLATCLIKENRSTRWNEYDLNEATQRIINQILFTRISEDRDIETGRLLEKIVADAVSLPERRKTLFEYLVDHFRGLDRTFNGSIFSPHFSDNLTISDDFIAEFIEDLSSDDSPYLFSTLPIEILGSVYERFLGKTLLIKGLHVALEVKPELRKAGGIYYTPRYIVEYITRGALQPKLAGKTPKQIRAMRVIDIACGSGSFLISAFEIFCEHLLLWLRDHPEEEKKQICYRDEQKQLHLTTHAKQEILVSHIFGLDLDKQAVEITKFSLYLKLLEDETRQTLLRQHTIPGLEREKYLPPLEKNIQSGNAIIGEDYYVRHLAFQVDENHIRYEVKPFEWRTRFAAAHASGGFDIVIGNPPYRRELNHKELMAEIAESEFGQKFSVARMDLWYYFVHRGLEMLRDDGVLAFITNSYWVASTGARKLVKAMRTESSLQEIFDLEKLKVFDEVSGQHMMFRLHKGRPQGTVLIKRCRGISRSAEEYVRGIADSTDYRKSHTDVFRGNSVDLEPADGEILEKICMHSPLSSLGLVRQGIAENPATVTKKTNVEFGSRWRIGVGVFSLTPNELLEMNLPDEEASIVVRYHDLCDIGRYFLARNPSRRLIYSTKDTWPILGAFPTIAAHLKKYSPIMKKRRETQKGSNSWWHLHWPRSPELWESSKIICLQMEVRPSFSIANRPCYVPFSANVFRPSQTCREHLSYIAALLNSRVLWKWFTHHAKRRGVALEINGGVLERAPIRRIDFRSSEQVELHDKVVRIADRLQVLGTDLRIRRSEQARSAIEIEFSALDVELDRIICQLYDLSPLELTSLPVAG